MTPQPSMLRLILSAAALARAAALRTRGRPHQRDGLARAARICWGRLPRC